MSKFKQIIMNKDLDLIKEIYAFKFCNVFKIF